jgi:hypothetical protein
MLKFCKAFGRRVVTAGTSVLGLVVFVALAGPITLAQCWNGGADGVFVSPACANAANNPCVYNTCLSAGGTCQYGGVNTTIVTSKVQNPPPGWYSCVTLPAMFFTRSCAAGPVACGGINTDYIDNYCTTACDSTTFYWYSCDALQGSSTCPGG